MFVYLGYYFFGVVFEFGFNFCEVWFYDKFVFDFFNDDFFGVELIFEYFVDFFDGFFNCFVFGFDDYFFDRVVEFYFGFLFGV